MFVTVHVMVMGMCVIVMSMALGGVSKTKHLAPKTNTNRHKTSLKTHFGKEWYIVGKRDRKGYNKTND